MPPRSAEAQLSAMLAWPERSDFTSVPVSSMPASQVSSMAYSKRARRFSAMRLWPSSLPAAMGPASPEGPLLGGLRLQETDALQGLVHDFLGRLRERGERQAALRRADDAE